MKKKIITLALAVVMCLSVITSVTAADTLVRVPSTIPGTDIEYNYVENVTVKIPGTEVMFELEKVAEQVGFGYYSDGTPSYTFVFHEGGAVTFNQDFNGIYVSQAGTLNHSDLWSWGDAWPVSCASGKTLTFKDYSQWNNSKMTRDLGGATRMLDSYRFSIKDENNDVAHVEFVSGIGDGVLPYDLIGDGEKIDISLLDVNYKGPTDYNIIEGANTVVNSDASSLTIKADGDFDTFTGVKVDGELVDISNYTATEGSTIIEFKADYISTLDAGKHTVSVVFTDGEATTGFEIKEADNNSNNNSDKNDSSDDLVTDVEIPNTDYNTSVAAAFMAMTFSGMAMVALKKKNK